MSRALAAAAARPEPVPRARRWPLALTRPALVAAGVFVGTFVFRILDPVIANDHFYWISGGRQILVYGELPFRDFRDPGWFLQHVASAGAQLVFGYNLFGELVLSLSLIALGTALAFLLARRASGSTAIALVVTAFVVATYPRLYNYPKLFLFVVALLLIWRYVDRPRPLALWLVGGWTAFATLFRHDYGLYIGVAAGVALLALHWRDGRALLVRRLALYGAVVAGAMLPFLLFIQLNGGLPAYLDASRRFSAREQTRSTAALPPRFELDPAAPLLATVLPPPNTLFARAQRAIPQLGIRPLPGLVRPENADAWLYYVWLGLPLATLAALGWKRVRRLPERLPGELPKLAAAAALCAVATPIMLRHPLPARFADVAAPSAVIAAWLLAEALRPAHAAGPRGRRWSALLRPTLVVLLVGLSWASLAAVAEGEAWLDRRGLLGRPGAALAQAARQIETTRISPPIDARPTGSRSVHQLMRYLRDCTRPSDRLVVAWFAPEIHFYTGRGQPRLDRIEGASVPIILTYRGRMDARDDRYAPDYELLARHYREVWADSSGTSRYSRLLVDTRREPTGTHPVLGLPCYG